MDERMMNWIQNGMINTNDDEENEVVKENEYENDKDYQERIKKPRKSETRWFDKPIGYIDSAL